jgi:hypothetical protein
MSRRLSAIVALALLAASFAVAHPRPAGAAGPTMPADFTDQLVTNVAKPTALAFTPDGRVLITTMTGQLRVVTPGAGLLATPALDVGPQSCAIHERGMLGAAVDAGFATNHFVFLFYTVKNGSVCGQNVDPYPYNRVSRFTLPDSNVIDPATEVVVLDHIPSRNGHNAGEQSWDEIDLGAAGADYGWNLREGHCAVGSTTDCGPPPAGLINPIIDYSRSSGCSSITGGAFVPAGLWPAPFDGAYLFADYVCGKIFRLAPLDTGGFAMADFATGLGASSATSLAFGPSADGQSVLHDVRRRRRGAPDQLCRNDAGHDGDDHAPGDHAPGDHAHHHGDDLHHDRAGAAGGAVKGADPRRILDGRNRRHGLRLRRRQTLRECPHDVGGRPRAHAERERLLDRRRAGPRLPLR